MTKPDINKLPTSQMMKFCQVFNLKTDETRAGMLAALGKVTPAQWTKAKVQFEVDQL